MAQTIFSAYFHIVFSTKHRADLIAPEIEAELYAYIGGIIRNFDGKLLAADGTPNHSHLLVSVNKSHLVPAMVGTVKRESTKWIKQWGGMLSKFGWQDGYAAFSVGHSQLPAVKRYIAEQKEHHRNKLFKDELRGFLKKYQIKFDEEYLWD